MGIVHPGHRNPNWKGGRSVASNGYVLVRLRGHPMADTRGYVYEHRLVASEKIGRPLLKGEIVHHINGDKIDNRPENIEVVESLHAHRVKHRTAHFDLRQPGEDNPSVSCKCGCGERFPRYDESGRPRAYVTGHNVTHDPITGRWRSLE